MPVNYIKLIEDQYTALGYSTYQWVVNEDRPPWTPLARPLAECRVGLVASGGIYVTGQVAFHYNDDTSYRVIPREVKTEDLRATHFAYDLTHARQDPNVVFPLDALRGLEKEGMIGRLADRFFTFMGGIYSARRVREELVPRLTEELLAEKVDAVLFVPV